MEARVPVILFPGYGTAVLPQRRSEGSAALSGSVYSEQKPEPFFASQ
jgi:hypothetical protein